MRYELGREGIEPLVVRLTCFKTTALQAAVRTTTRVTFLSGGCWNRTNFFGSSDRRDDHIRKPSDGRNAKSQEPNPNERLGHWDLEFGSWNFSPSTSWGI